MGYTDANGVYHADPDTSTAGSDYDSQYPSEALTREQVAATHSAPATVDWSVPPPAPSGALQRPVQDNSYMDRSAGYDTPSTTPASFSNSGGAKVRPDLSTSNFGGTAPSMTQGQMEVRYRGTPDFQAAPDNGQMKPFSGPPIDYSNPQAMFNSLIALRNARKDYETNAQVAKERLGASTQMAVENARAAAEQNVAQTHGEYQVKAFGVNAASRQGVADTRAAEYENRVDAGIMKDISDYIAKRTPQGAPVDPAVRQEAFDIYGQGGHIPGWQPSAGQSSAATGSQGVPAPTERQKVQALISHNPTATRQQIAAELENNLGAGASQRYAAELSQVPQ